MRRDRALLADILKRALPAEVQRRIYSLPLIERRWAAVVGEGLARRSEPEALAEGVLSVRVTDPAWGRMLLKLQGRIIPALNRAVGMNLVRRINFVRRDSLSRPDSDTFSPPEPAPLGPPPESVMKASEAVSDPELRALVRRSASLYLRARDDRKRS
ncbi:MAG: DUF721 domain-containing protein [Vicinamibacteria bacterium]